MRTLGLFPASDDVAVPAAAIALGRALAQASRQPAGVVDALGTWPCARALAGRDSPDGAPLCTSWIDAGLALVTPRALDPVDAVSLMIAVMERVETFDHLVFDLTGLDHVGEHIAAFDLLDAVVLIARCGRTTTRQVQRWLREIPGGSGLGVLLTGS